MVFKSECRISEITSHDTQQPIRKLMQLQEQLQEGKKDLGIEGGSHFIKTLQISLSQRYLPPKKASSCSHLARLAAQTRLSSPGTMVLTPTKAQLHSGLPPTTT